ncbi:hypothetical protein P4K84_22380 [Bacillus cereus]|uniref:hypothetical protein n=1 Tax=Bacillus cereus TaxID=1396 RepID=UPI000BF9E2A7|nr:hypothetical protein [Bacillus cereus]MEB9946763.1 hypothetical protein [Bacillus cereus]PFF41011.1 hypothetical protein CN328_18170 [Bacillus cereus]PGN92979.1 hypothetical protein CN965_16195 [Bacillus cereus]PGV31190.1 hypothetical protein COD79_23345 [Bacillus cereus]PGX87172.1 hypothetical protein COE28_09795 [Bacillus cereus]
MYIDYIKETYSDKEKEEIDLYVQRDKNHLGKIILENIRNDIENIVERWWELENVGYFSSNEKFLELLKEAENLYYFGNYTSCIAMIGIATEEFCRYLADNHKINSYKLTQDDRLKLLKNSQIISNNTYKKFNFIRKLRNSCMHYNKNFKSLDMNVLKVEAVKALNYYKNGIKNSIKAESPDLDTIVDKLISNNELSFNEFKLRQRNINKQKNDIDVQISPKKKNLIFQSNYYIADIDIETEDFKEMTLFDINSGSGLVLDLTLPDVNNVINLKLEVGNVIFATLISNVSSIGLSEEWKLLSIDDVYYGYYSL